MMLRKRKPEGLELGKLLEGYHASALPPPPSEAVLSVRCGECNKPNIYPAKRQPPGRCSWCRAVL